MKKSIVIICNSENWHSVLKMNVPVIPQIRHILSPVFLDTAESQLLYAATDKKVAVFTEAITQIEKKGVSLKEKLR